MTTAIEAKRALQKIKSLHPTDRIVVGSSTHGGSIQYAEGCGTHGAWCLDWSLSRAAIATLDAYLDDEVGR